MKPLPTPATIAPANLLACLTAGALAACALAAWLLVAPADLALAQGTPAGPVITMGERGREYYFEPNELTVPTGPVQFTFKNVGGRRHNFVLHLPGGDQRTPDVDAGRDFTATFTIPAPGTYEFICDLPNHARFGMAGRLTAVAGPVGTAGQAGQAATAAPGGTTGGAGSAGSPGQASAATSGQAPSTLGASRSATGLPLLISLAIHIPAAIAWLGVVLYDAIVVAVPYLSPAQRGGLLQRPKWLVLLTIPLFFSTGIYQTIFNPINTVTDFASLEALRHETTYGTALFWKHGFVLLSMALTLAMTFWIGPQLVRLGDGEGADAGAARSRLPSLLTWGNVAACIALLTCVAVIVYQLH